MSVSVLLVGAGLTNSLIAKNIRSCTKLSKLLDVYVWEKTGQIGGRFQTTTAAGVQNVPPTDFAAQYVTFTKGQGQEWAEPYFTELVKADMIKKITLPPHPGYPQDYKKDNYAFTQGAAAVVKYFFNQGGLNETNIKLNHNLLGIKMRDNYKIDVSYEERTKDGKTRHTGCFDAVISTIPIPAFLESEIIHSASDLNYPNGTHSKLSNIQYKSRYAVGLYFDRRIEVAPGEQKYNFVRKSGNPICYWTLEEDKTTGNSFIVVHTTVSFGKEYMNHPMAKVESVLVEKAYQEIKSISGLVPTQVKGQSWKNSQVHIPYDGSPGFLEISDSPPLILTGDGFSSSAMEGCISSAIKTTERLKELFNEK